MTTHHQGQLATATLRHSQTALVTRDQLRLIPRPECTRSFRPVPHTELIETLDELLTERRMSIIEERYSIRRDGSRLFGVLKLQYGDAVDRTAAMGLRTANDKTMRIQICVGMSVFVCDNLVFRGDMIALSRKHTSRLDLIRELNGALDRFTVHYGHLLADTDALKERAFSDVEAKALIFDVFAKGLMPVRLLPKVSWFYFCPAHAEFEPRTAWSLHNALTEAANEMPLTTRVPAVQAIGRLFGLSNGGAR